MAITIPPRMFMRNSSAGCMRLFAGKTLRSDLTVVSRSFETMKVRGLMKDAFHYYQAGYNETGRTAGEACAVFVEKSYPLR